MNILYSGCNLRDGLRQLGHTLLDLPFAPEQDIREALAAAPCPVDMVCIELWSSLLPAQLLHCPVPLVAWCVDAPLNAHWQIPYAALFDHVFVDQKSSVQHFARYGRSVAWLPFFAQERDFRPIDTPKEHDLVFVGTTSPERTKRNNILRLLQKHFSFPVVQGISTRQMADMFARSRVVLNENLFSGLTARVFQGMAAGAVVFTEAGGCGVDDHFTDGTHFVSYNSSTICDALADILHDYSRCQDIARAGHALCRQRHTATDRAAQMLRVVASAPAAREPREDVRRFRAAQGRYQFVLAHRGSVQPCLTVCAQTMREGGPCAGEAACLLGQIAIRRGQRVHGQATLRRAWEQYHEPRALLLLAQTAASDGDLAAAHKAIHLYAAHTGLAVPAATTTADILLLLAWFHARSGEYFPVGCLKTFDDACPDSALELAQKAHALHPCARTMDAMLEYAAPAGLSGELLPSLLDLISKVRASDSQILRAAALAKDYYDLELSASILACFKKARFCR